MTLNFGFKTSIERKNKDINLAIWDDLIKNEIDNNRPIFYFGDGSNPHIWLVDGYDGSLYHCNWGWGTDNNEEWYYLSSLYPYGEDFNSYQGGIFYVEPILDGESELTGPSFICVSDTVTYSVDIPSTASVQWGVSDGNLTTIGGTTNTSFTVTPNWSGSCTISALIKNSHGQTFFVKSKDVNVGCPVPGISNTWSDACNCYENGSLETYEIYDWDMITNNPSTNSYDYVWTIYDYYILPLSATGPITIMATNYPYTTYGKHLSFSFDQEGTYTIKAKQRMCNTWSDWAMKYVTVGSGGLLLQITPNPATSEATISLGESNQGATLKSASVGTETNFAEEWELEVYDSRQVLMEKQTKIKSNNVKIDTQGWKEGVYIVRVNCNDEILQSKLVVKK